MSDGEAGRDIVEANMPHLQGWEWPVNQVIE